MNENRRTHLGFAHDGSTPSPLAAWTARRLHGSGTSLRRRPINRTDRRDAFRAGAGSIVPCSENSLALTWQMSSELSIIRLHLDGMSDAGRGEAITNGHRWRFGRGALPVGWLAIADTVDGLHYEGNGIFTDWTITTERNSAVECGSTFSLLNLTDTDSATGLAAAPSSGRLATSLSASASIDGGTDPVMSIVLGIQRDVTAAGYDEAGAASVWAGPMVPDFAGRIVCRAPAGTYDEALRDQITAPLEITYTLPDGSTLTFTLPNVIFQATTRALVNKGSYEYALEFAGIQVGIDDVATAELITPP